MARVVLLHHALGLTQGVIDLAERLSRGGHEVVTPDLFDGRVPSTLQEGLAIAGELGDEHMESVARAAGEEAGPGVVWAGISLGVAVAQRIVQTTPGAGGAVLLEAALPVSGEWAIGPWPPGVPVQIHGMDRDEFFALEGDVDAAREIVATAGPSVAELFVYPGDAHLFTDASLPQFDAASTDLVVERVLRLLERVGE
jgi:dienelactone hydrolase